MADAVPIAAEVARATSRGPRTKLAKRAVELPNTPHISRNKSRVRIEIPDQICQPVWWFFTDHQLNAISPTSSQWTSRTGKSQTGCLGAGSSLSGACPCDSCRGTPNRCGRDRHNGP